MYKTQYHKCPECLTLCEKYMLKRVSCTHMHCYFCSHHWCICCGADNDISSETIFNRHELIGIPCSIFHQITSFGVLLGIPVAIAVLAILPIIFYLFLFFGHFDVFKTYMTIKSNGTLANLLWGKRKRGCWINLLITIPLWLIIIAIFFLDAVVVLIVFILPTYILFLWTFIKVLRFRSKKKRMATQESEPDVVKGRSELFESKKHE